MPHPDEPIWKQRYERLWQFMADAEFSIRRSEIERSETRAWDAPPVLYVSFALDAVPDEDWANKNFGEGKYDTYRLERKGDAPAEQKEDAPAKHYWTPLGVLKKSSP